MLWSVVLVLLCVSFARSELSERLPFDLTNEKRQSKITRFQARWLGNRRWPGPSWFANPFYDWSVRNNKLVGKAAQGRSLSLLTAELTDSGLWFQAQVVVNLKTTSKSQRSFRNLGAGFQIGRRGRFADYRNSAIYPTTRISALLNQNGKLTLNKKLSNLAFPLALGPIKLTLSGRKFGKLVLLILTGERRTRKSRVQLLIPAGQIRGGVSLSAEGLNLKPQFRRPFEFEFDKFFLEGNMVRRYEARKFGPIYWTQYTLNQRTLRIQAQLAPLDRAVPVSLWVLQGNSKWKKIKTAFTDSLSQTAVFTIKKWNSSKNQKYQVRNVWLSKTFSWDGMIRKEPGKIAPLKVACFSCDYGYLFPLKKTVQQIRRQNPDMMLFLGDQIYEWVTKFPAAFDASLPIAILDFMHKYSLFGWVWRDLLRDRPSIIIPDDHDVYHGNLWGDGGKTLKFPKRKMFEYGGYLMPGKWVAAVERIHVGNLPNPAVDITLPIGIKPYFTSLVYGGVGFAVLEDRKFKTAPFSLPLNRRSAGVGAQLLGSRQEKFLNAWAKNWAGQEMKCALSQTMFAKPETHSGPRLPPSRYIFDNGAWPKAARDRTVKILGDNNVFTIHGDRHLGMLVRQGIKNFNDAGYAFMVPGVANGWPRAWWPGVKRGVPKPGQKFTGKYRDVAGNPLNVLAVANPMPGSSRVDPRLVSDIQGVANRRRSGYGIVVFNKVTKTIKVNLYQSTGNGKTFDGFPKTLRVGGKPK